jgi:hypothetical protein
MKWLTECSLASPVFGDEMVVDGGQVGIKTEIKICWNIRKVLRCEIPVLRYILAQQELMIIIFSHFFQTYCSDIPFLFLFFNDQVKGQITVINHLEGKNLLSGQEIQLAIRLYWEFGGKIYNASPSQFILQFGILTLPFVISKHTIIFCQLSHLKSLKIFFFFQKLLLGIVFTWFAPASSVEWQWQLRPRLWSCPDSGKALKTRKSQNAEGNYCQFDLGRTC